MNQQQEAIKLKLNKSKVLMDDIEKRLENELYVTVVSSLYYACFYVTQALLLTKDIAPKTHEGVERLLAKHFVLENLFDVKRASFFKKLMAKRIINDYSDIIFENKEQVEEFVEPAKEYVAYVTKIVEDYLTQQQ